MVRLARRWSHRPGWSCIKVTAIKLMLAASLACSSSSTGSAGGPPSDCTGSGYFSCEPDGMRLVTDYGFDALNSGGWSYTTWDASARITQDGASPGDANVLEFLFPEGFVGGGAPARVAAPEVGDGVRELFWGFTWQASAGWTGHSSGVNKIGYGWQNGASTFGLTWYWHGGGTTASPSISLFDAGITYFHSNTEHARPIEAGRWYRVEVYYRPSSSSGRRDGIVRIWVDGVLMANHVDVVTTPGRISDVYFEPTWGGIGDTKPRSETFRIGQSRISVR